MTNIQDKLLKDKLYRKEISLEDYYRGLSIYTENNDEFRIYLKETILYENASTLENLIYIGYKNQLFNVQLIDELNELLIAKWHTRHEEIAAILCNFPIEKSLNYVKECAETDWEHEAYNDGVALRGKLLFIVRKINTKEAIKLLETYSEGENLILKNEAKRQLNKM